MSTITQQLYERAKNAGKVDDSSWLRLGIKNPQGRRESTGPHQVKFLKDQVIEGRDYHTREKRKEVEYIFEENGEQKKYRCPIYGKDGQLHYFLRKMNDFTYGDKLILEMKSLGDKNVINVSRVGISDVKDEDIPIIEEDSYPTDLPDIE